MKHCTTLYVGFDVHKNMINVAHVASDSMAYVIYISPIGKKYGICPNTVTPNSLSCSVFSVSIPTLSGLSRSRFP